MCKSAYYRIPLRQFIISSQYFMWYGQSCCSIVNADPPCLCQLRTYWNF